MPGHSGTGYCWNDDRGVELQLVSWSYSPSLLTDPTQGPLMQVRLTMGDTYVSDQQVSDEEILFYLSTYSVLGSAAAVCRALASKFSRSVDYKAGGTDVKYSQLAKQYTAMAADLEMQSSISGGGLPYAGGLSQADKLQQQLDSDRVGDWFKRNEFDDPYFDGGNSVPTVTEDL